MFTKQENETTKWLVGQWICKDREKGIEVGMAGKEDVAARALGGLGPVKTWEFSPAERDLRFT